MQIRIHFWECLLPAIRDKIDFQACLPLVKKLWSVLCELSRLCLIEKSNRRSMRLIVVNALDVMSDESCLGVIEDSEPRAQEMEVNALQPGQQ